MGEIHVTHATKEIKGTRLLDDINLEVQAGEIVGIVGKNGSGKTLLLKLLAGLMQPTEGKVEVISEHIGIVIENASMYPDFSGFENLQYLAKIRNRIKAQEIVKIMEILGLDPNEKRKVKNYSLGMRQKLALAQAFMEQPDVLLLDEPTNALDKESVKKLYRLIEESKKRNAIVLIVSHNHEDIQTLCDVIYYMAEGKLISDDKDES
ncbi:MAG: ABC transporter ATP-binding protein [Lachnospiraceae bacterium]|nr:ABC transporter ATP-binding protein [Lachnospiraceae bacterium]